MVDTYAVGTQVSDLIFNVNAMRSAIPSQVKQPFWDGFDPSQGDDQPFLSGAIDDRAVVRRVAAHLLLLPERGIELNALWLARARYHGARAWISMRMNDIHWVSIPDHSFHDRFWREHPEYRRAPHREFESQHDRAFDYGHRAVRDRHLAYAREAIHRYDIDGLELDWMREAWHFRPGQEEEGVTILTAFTAEVRRAMDARPLSPYVPRLGRSLGRIE